jgi:hypothetical protein
MQSDWKAKLPISLRKSPTDLPKLNGNLSQPPNHFLSFTNGILEATIPGRSVHSFSAHSLNSYGEEMFKYIGQYFLN